MYIRAIKTLLHIQETYTTPSLTTNDDCTKLLVRGKCIPENAREFFKNLFDWYKSSFKEPALVEIVFRFELEYISSSSIAELFSFLKFIALDRNKFRFIIEWVYEKDEESIQDIGEKFADLIPLKFVFIEQE
ncbi:MAG: SiaC family regulatory phosphoprotein [Bacteroidia bacterium]